jgi:hypothetical protein
MKSTVHGLVSVDTAPLIVNEITLVGSRCGRFEPALKLLRASKVNVEGYDFSRVPARRCTGRIRARCRKNVMKVLLRGPA